ERGGAPPAARAPPEPHPPSLVRVKEASAVSRAAPAGRSGTPVRPGILDGVREGNRAVHPLRALLLYVLRDRPTRTRSPATCPPRAAPHRPARRRCAPDRRWAGATPPAAPTRGRRPRG